MKKLTFALIATAVSFAASAAPNKISGTLEATTSHATLSESWPNARITAVSALFNMHKQDKLGFSITNVDAWGETANYLNVRTLNHINRDLWADINLGVSDKGKITAHRRVNAMLNQKFTSVGVILGGGFDYYTMREGGSATSVKGSVVKYVQGLPLVLQGDLAWTRSNFNARNGWRVGGAATYGYHGRWTVSAAGSTGRVHYELERQPGTVADYNSDHVSVTGRYWLNKDWGLSAGYDKVSNEHYERDEVRVGLFMNF